MNLNRRTALALAASASLSFARASQAAPSPFQFRYALASCMYGYTPLAEILPEAEKIGASGIDIWPKVHGDQREQLDALGEDRFAAMLREHDVELSCITQYKLGPFGIDDEIRLAERLGCKLIVTGGSGPRNLKGAALKEAIAAFLKKLTPTIKLARDHGVRIAIENHENNLIHDADSLRYLVDLAPADAIAVAFAPYHLPQDNEVLCRLLRDLGDSVAVFYAWQHGMGCKTKLPKEQELLQMPGRGDLDFGPIVKTLAEMQFDGWTEIFMHPVPRGIPILATTDKVTAEINRSRKYLEQHLIE
ncbi:Xylose isomerase-like TIM barrel [Stieleria neptunia]|uniref:Xylose isomerase-like TIM barrel n=1 Tax=Stieleria neptunia TaxID=2527979 RepID=A0A518HQD5_9BACT|nr:sugar phosphate isomerase/epimerase family protein [Stieleria neptunia]QDV43066.1 Xylose isomerase-like TIM barrel [Stieleria neptunia]